MMVDTRIYGYVTDGGAYHPEHLPDGIDPSRDDTVSALFSYHDDDPYGLSCDGCWDYIFEPDPTPAQVYADVTRHDPLI